MDTSPEYILQCEKATELRMNISDNKKGFGQDQLQKMIPLPSEYHRICDKLYAFTDWVKEHAGYETSNCTMEQLWLSFVMWTLYHKKWYNGEWRTEDDRDKPIDKQVSV